MELKVTEYQLPDKISFNFEELKQELTEKVSHYETMVYTDDKIKLAKEDRANLNKLKKALNDERIRREKEYMIPFNAFKAQVNEIIAIIDKPVSVIDERVKEYEERQKKEKENKIREYWSDLHKEDKIPFPMSLNSIFDDKWLNASVSMKSIQEEINKMLEQIATDLAALSNLPEFSFEATEVYKYTLDITKALNEAHRLSEVAKKKAEYDAEQERLAAEAEAKKIHDEESQFATEIIADGVPTTQVAPERQWVSFKAFLTVDDAIALKRFFDAQGIQFEQI